MKETPNLANTKLDDVLNERRAPACVLVGLEVNGNESDVRLGVIVMVFDDEGELWKSPEVTIVCWFCDAGAKKS